MNDLKHRVTRAIDAWNSGDLEGYLSLYDPSIILHGYAPEPMDFATVRGFYTSVFAGLPFKGKKSPELALFDPMVDGRWYACHFCMSGSHTGPFMGVPATDRPYHVTGVTMIRFNDENRAMERHSSFDALGLMVQIGAVPAPG